MSDPCRGDCNEGRDCYCGAVVDKGSDRDLLAACLIASAAVSLFLLAVITAMVLE